MGKYSKSKQGRRKGKVEEEKLGGREAERKQGRKEGGRKLHILFFNLYKIGVHIYGINIKH